jgi:membrane protease subunit (stomatin/prohibitin family)
VLLQHLSDAVAQSGIPFLDLAANQIVFAKAIMQAVAPSFAAMGIQIETLTVQNVSLPEELQKVLDQKIGMGMVGQNMGQFMQYQAAQSLPTMAASAGQGGSVVGDAAGLGAGLALGQVMAQTLQQGLQAPAAAAAPVSVDDVMATLEKLADLKAKGILTEEEFSSKKAELLKKIA